VKKRVQGGRHRAGNCASYCREAYRCTFFGKGMARDRQYSDPKEKEGRKRRSNGISERRGKGGNASHSSKREAWEVNV